MKALALLSLLGALCAGLVVVVGGTAAPGPCPPGDVPIEINGYAFSPTAPTVAPGTTVCWTNKDPVAHTVTSVGNFDSGLIPPGDIFRHTFSSEGTFLYACEVLGHSMSGQVLVSAGAPPPPPPSPPPPSPPPSPPPAPPPPPPPPASPARLSVTAVRISVERRGSRQTLVARARVTRGATARLSLQRRQRTLASARKRWVAGVNTIRTPLPASLAPGPRTAVLQVGTRRFSRAVRIG